MKHKLLSKLNNCAFIVDDLERASSKQLTSEVLGECLNLVENNINIAIVVLANEDHIEDKSILEKTFNNKVVLTTSPSDIVKIIKQKYPSTLDDVTSQAAFNAITVLQLSNLRIVQRAMQRCVPIIDRIKKLPDVDIGVALPRIIEQVFRICYAHYEYDASYDELCKGAESVSFEYLYLGDQSSEEKKTPEVEQSEQRLKNISNVVEGAASKVTPALISYSLNIAFIPEELVEDFNLPLKGKLLDRVKSMGIHDLSDSDFAKAIDEAREFLFDSTTEPKHFFEWFRVLDSYFYLLELNYISGDINEVYKRAEAMVHTLGALKPIHLERHHAMNIRGLDHFLARKLYDIANPLNDKLANKMVQSTLQDDFLSSWSKANGEIYQKYGHTPFLHQFDVHSVCQALEGWIRSDIVVFGQFIRNRYTSGNTRDFLQEEFEFVRQLKSELEKISSSLPASHLKGCFSELIAHLVEGIKFIEKAENYKSTVG